MVFILSPVAHFLEFHEILMLHYSLLPYIFVRNLTNIGNNIYKYGGVTMTFDIISRTVIID